MKECRGSGDFKFVRVCDGCFPASYDSSSPLKYCLTPVLDLILPPNLYPKSGEYKGLNRTGAASRKDTEDYKNWSQDIDSLSESLPLFRIISSFLNVKSCYPSPHPSHSYIAPRLP